MKKICMVTTSRIDIDSRIQNEAEALSKKFKVTVLSRKYDQPITLKNTPYKIKRIPYQKLWPYKLNVLSAIWALYQAALKEKPDFYHAHDLDGLLATARAAQRNKKPLIYDSHDLWSEDLIYRHLWGIGWLIPVLEKFLMRYMDYGITTSQGIAKELKKKYHRDFILIRNMPKLSALKKSALNFRKEYPGEIVIVHAGQVGPSRGIAQMIEAMRYLPTNFILVFLGGLSNQICEEQIKKEKLEERVHFIKEVPPAELVNALKTADMGIVMTEGLSRSKYLSLPNKLLQYIAAEIPILASDIPEHRRIIATEKIGELTEVQPREIARKILTMLKEENLKNYHQNLKGLAQKKYNWRIESKKLLYFYNKLLKT